MFPDYLAAKLQSALLQAAKIALGPSAARQSTSTIFHRIGWLSYRQLEYYCTTKIAMRAMDTNVPQSLAAIIPKIGTQTTWAQQKGKLNPPNWKFLATTSSFKFRATAIINSIPADIRGMKPGRPRNLELKAYIRLNITPYISGLPKVSAFTNNITPIPTSMTDPGLTPGTQIAVFPTLPHTTDGAPHTTAGGHSVSSNIAHTQISSQQ